MVVAGVQIANRDQRLDPLRARLADADQQAGGEGHAGFTGRRDRGQPGGGLLVRRSVMRPPFATKPIGRAFEHQAHRCAVRAQRGIVARRHQAGIQVRQQAGLVDHGAGGLCQIGERRRVAQRGERVARGVVARFRPVAERKQCLAASHPLAAARDLQHLIERQIGVAGARGRGRESAVMAYVAT